MEPSSVVEAFDEGKDIAPSLGSGLVLAMMNELSLEDMEEALHRGIVVAVGFAAHRCGEPAVARVRDIHVRLHT